MTANKIFSAHPLWNALYVKSRHEKKAALFMDKMGLEYYLPLVKSLKFWSDRKKWVIEPLFRGYVFIPHLPALHEQYVQVPGVVNFVRYNKEDAVIRAEELSVLQLFIERGYHLEAMDTKHLYKGDKVHVIAGPFIGAEAEVIRTLNNNSCLLALESLGQIVKVTLPLNLVVGKDA